jgi:hypothetical protein
MQWGYQGMYCWDKAMPCLYYNPHLRSFISQFVIFTAFPVHICKS